jgi:hypothetical protein
MTTKTIGSMSSKAINPLDEMPPAIDTMPEVSGPFDKKVLSSIEISG